MSDPDFNSFQGKYFPDPPLPSQPYGFRDLVVSPVTPEDIRDVLAHTEVINAPEADLVVSPGQVWVMEREPSPWGQSVSWEVTLHEDQFWRLVEAFLGPEAMQEMKHDLDDLLRWEGEGGPCLVD